MPLTRRTSILAVVLAALVGVASFGMAPAHARSDSFAPAAPSGPSRPDVLAPTPPTVPLTFAIHDTEVVEGDPGDSNALAFEITASKAPASDVTLRAHTGNLGFEATPGVDFVPIDEIVTMPAGETSIVVEVPVIGDLEAEHDELVIIWISDPSAGSIELSGSTALGRILDDDTPTIHIDDVMQFEGSGGGYTPFVFTISLSKAVDHPVSVNVWTVDGTAKHGIDYIAPAMTVEIPAGETSAPYTVSVFADDHPESDKEFAVQLDNPVGGTIVGGGGLGTIVDDDHPAVPLGPDSLKAKQKAAGSLGIRLTMILNG
jgi:hypothetical protein